MRAPFTLTSIFSAPTSPFTAVSAASSSVRFSGLPLAGKLRIAIDKNSADSRHFFCWYSARPRFAAMSYDSFSFHAAR
jgi:hypothetical protein